MSVCLQVVITGSEFDAVAVHQATRLPTIALPSGTLSLPPEVSPSLLLLWSTSVWVGVARFCHSWSSLRRCSSGLAVKPLPDRPPPTLPGNSALPAVTWSGELSLSGGWGYGCGLISQETGSSPLAALGRGHTHLLSALRNSKPFVNKQIVTFQQVTSIHPQCLQLPDL